MKPAQILVLALVAAIAAALSATDAAAHEPTFDCTKTDHDVEDAICTNSGLAELDIELARLCGLARNGPNLDNREAELVEDQRSWFDSRNQCWKSPLGVEDCTADAYAFGIAELRTAYAHSRPEKGASGGPFAYRCDGLDEIFAATFVQTSTPMVVLSWLDFGMVLPLVPAGSGAKYASDKWNDQPPSSG